MENTHHPLYPQSNVSKFSGYEPDKYAIDEISLTVKTNECLTPGRPPTLTQNTVGKFLQPLTRALVEVPPRPTIDELPDAVIDRMVQMDKAFWVDKPGDNAYTLHDAYYNYGMTTEKVLPPHQDVFPRSYQFDLDCVKYRRLHACDNFKPTEEALKKYTMCRDCHHVKMSDLMGSKSTYEQDSGQKRWRQYPDVKATLSPQQIREMMKDWQMSWCLLDAKRSTSHEHLLRLYSYTSGLLTVKDRRVGRPFQNEACNWYYTNYPPVKYNCIMRKFSK